MQQRETTGTVVSVARQWWLKVNTKPIRTGPSDGTVFPHIIKVVEDTENDGFVLSASGYKSVFMKYGSYCFHPVSVMNY